MVYKALEASESVFVAHSRTGLPRPILFALASLSAIMKSVERPKTSPHCNQLKAKDLGLCSRFRSLPPGDRPDPGPLTHHLKSDTS